jgi:hypothetical protein
MTVRARREVVRWVLMGLAIAVVMTGMPGVAQSVTVVEVPYGFQGEEGRTPDVDCCRAR